MPTGILIIPNMFPEFTTAAELQQQIDAYFIHIEGEYHFANTSDDIVKKQPAAGMKKVWDRESQPATLSGLILFLGFESRADFDMYETSGAFSGTLKRGRLRIEAEYEKKLHFQSPTGAIFALKKLGWDETNNNEKKSTPVTTLQIEIINTGFTPADNEKQVSLE